jgi:hypothetical protein
MLAAIAACAALLCLAGCKENPDVKVFDQIYQSDFGLGLSFEWTSSQVVYKLGEPDERTTKQNGLNIEERYLPESLVDTEGKTIANVNRDTPQFSVTYLDSKLVRLYNRYYPEDPEQPLPPFFFEPIKGVKLGNRRSDFVMALGKPDSKLFGEEWRFKAEDGRTISIRAQFTEIETGMEVKGDELCSRLQIVLAPAMEELRGEEVEKQEAWKEQLK